MDENFEVNVVIDFKENNINYVEKNKEEEEIEKINDTNNSEITSAITTSASAVEKVPNEKIKNKKEAKKFPKGRRSALKVNSPGGARKVEKKTSAGEKRKDSKNKQMSKVKNT